MNHILYKKLNQNYHIHERVTGNPPIRTYVKKLENRIIFKVKTWTFNT